MCAGLIVLSSLVDPFPANLIRRRCGDGKQTYDPAVNGQGVVVNGLRGGGSGHRETGGATK
jgi:hypothetical protein